MVRARVALMVSVIALTACSQGSGSGSSRSSLGEISRLAAKAKQARYKITYARIGFDTRTFVLAQDPPNSFIDRGDLSAYKGANGRFTLCSKVGSSFSCKRLSGAQALLQQTLLVGPLFGAIGAQFVADAPRGIDGLADIVPVSTTIVGRPARCVTLTGASLRQLDPTATGSFKACLDRESGVLLDGLTRHGDGATLEVVAKDYGPPTDAEFVPPAAAKVP